MYQRAQAWCNTRANPACGAGRNSSSFLFCQAGVRHRGVTRMSRASRNGRPMRTRGAVLPDAEQVQSLIAAYSGDGTLLPRSLAEICENIRDFVVLEYD